MTPFPHPNFHLFLDDMRDPREVDWVPMPANVHWVIVRSFAEFKRTIEHEMRKGSIPGFIAFDHDLAGEHYDAMRQVYHKGKTYEEAFKDTKEKTGFHCAKWLVEDVLQPYDLDCPPFVVHSMNPDGKANIEAYLNSYNKSRQLKEA